MKRKTAQGAVFLFFDMLFPKLYNVCMKKVQRKKPKGQATYSGDEVGLILERVEEKFDFLAEGFSLLSDGQDRLEKEQKKLSQKFDNLEMRFDGLGTRFGGLEETVSRMDKRLIRVEGKVEEIDNRLVRVEDDVIEIKHKLSEKVDREEFNKLEKRLVKLEKLVLSKG